MPAWLLSPFAKVGGALLAAALVVIAFNVWLGKRDDAAFRRGVDSTEAQVRQETDRANAAERKLELSMNTTQQLIGQRAQAQASALTIKLEPLQKDLVREIQADAGSRCRVADGVLGTLKAQRAAVNAGIAASDPGQP
jgi:hypothetical protein